MQINCLKLLQNIILRTTASIHITTFEKPNQSPAQEIWDMPKKTWLEKECFSVKLSMVSLNVHNMKIYSMYYFLLPERG